MILSMYNPQIHRPPLLAPSFFTLLFYASPSTQSAASRRERTAVSANTPPPKIATSRFMAVREDVWGLGCM
ncbi:hypothetical protein CC80DRAFT_34851 [Byssothecium circinans]|uniref:Uncharacterized protein n=1 Tax=Byssothecium circinans TaxID=147558 RepID=A0A6A5TZI9_9PLEO|nr:hypothetical protein CC80DRAFT_34851 [Byssothecium circinans]